MQGLCREGGLGLFAERCLASPFQTVVVAPDCGPFSARSDPPFVYAPFTAFERSRSHGAARDVLPAPVDRIRPQHAEPGAHAEGLALEATFVTELKGSVGSAWTARFDLIARARERSSRNPTCPAAILAAPRRGISAGEGGVCTPQGGDGLFRLLSI